MLVTSPKLLTCFLVTLVLLAAKSRAQDPEDPDSAATPRWTGFMGENRNGHVDYFGQRGAWPETLKQVWDVDVGTGYSSPLVVDGKVFQQSRQGEHEALWCLDLQTGKPLWRQSYEVPFKIGGGGEKHGKGPKSSPVYAEGRIFTLSIRGDLSAWNAQTGELLWRTDYGREFDQNHPYWGVATSPIVSGELVIAHFGNDERGCLTAIDAGTGREVWRLVGDGPSYSSPLVLEIEGIQQIVEWNHNSMVGVDVTTGSLLWSFPFPHIGSDQNMPTPVMFEGIIILGGENRGIRGLVPRQKNGDWTVDVLWEQKEVALDMSTAVINGGQLYGFSHYGAGRLFCLDPRNGKVHWQGPGRTGENVAFLSLPQYVVALVNHGQLRIIRATPERYQEVVSYRVSDAETWAPPVVLPDGFLIKDSTRLARWRFPE